MFIFDNSAWKIVSNEKFPNEVILKSDLKKLKTIFAVEHH